MRNEYLNIKVRKMAKIRNQCNQAPHLSEDNNGKVTKTHVAWEQIYVDTILLYWQRNSSGKSNHKQLFKAPPSNIS